MSSVTFFTSDMDKVREEVRALQEHRARVLMEQITEMQKERDVANARIRTLERTVLGENHCMCMYIYLHVYFNQKPEHTRVTIPQTVSFAK